MGQLHLEGQCLAEHLLRDLASRPWSELECHLAADGDGCLMTGEGVARCTQVPHPVESACPPLS